MNVRQRRKLFAGAGMITMLFGALMVLAPTGAGAVVVQPDDLRLDNGGNLQCAALNTGYTTSGKQDTVGAQTSGTISESGFSVDWSLVLNGDGDADNQISITVNTGSAAVSAVIIKTGNADNPNSNGVTAYEEYNPALGAGGTDLIDFPGDAISNIRVCGGTPTTTPQYGSFTIDKVLAGGDLKPAEDTSFPIEISCSNGATPINLNGDAPGDAVTVQVKPSDPVWNSSSLGVPLPVNATCLVEETPVPTGSAVSYKIGTAAATPNGDGQITVTIGSTPQAVEVTNTYGSRQPGTGGLTVSKVAGNNAPTTTPAPQFTFTVDCDVDGTAIDPDPGTTGNQETFQLTFGQNKPFTGLPDDATCDVKETVKGTATSTTHKVDNGAVVNSDTASDVAITADQDATVAFTNNYPGGGGGCVENPDTPGPDCGFIPPLGCVDNAATPQNECLPDACPNISGDQAAGTDCNPVVVTDACPLLPGTQRLPASCIEVLPEETERPPVVTPPVVTPPVETPPPAIAPERQERPEVKGDVVARTLPKTGNESRDLAAFGAGLLLLGAGLVLTSRSRFARVD